jgi:transketolase
MAGTEAAAGRFDCRDAFAKTLEALADADARVVAVVNDSVGSSKLGGFKAKFGARLVNVGIAEQLMVGVGAGLANGGMIPFVSAASCFITGRALEQVKADVAYSGFNVKLVGQSAGIAYGELGPTHHSIEDFAWLRALKDIIVLVPADPWETEAAVRFAHRHEGPVYIRLGRMGVPALPHTAPHYVPGQAEVLNSGTDVTLIGLGTTVHLTLAAAELLATEGISARVLNMMSLNPLDEAAILTAARETGALVTAEEALVSGGLGGAVAELLTANDPVPLNRVGFSGFQPTGTVAALFAEAGLTAEGIAAAARAAMARKRPQ